MRTNNVTEIKSEDTESKCENCIHGLVCNRPTPPAEVNCDMYAPDEATQLKEACDTLVKALLDSPLGQALTKVLNLLSDALDKVVKKQDSDNE